jgi:1-deoxy-D-xylulose-5-phosphate reductoisomerase
MRNIIVLGATGSIGSQTLNVINQNADELNLIGISLYDDLTALPKILKKFPNLKYVWALSPDKKKYPQVTFVNSLEELASLPCDLVVCAIVGFAAFAPLVSAINTKHNVALANKECLVAAGDYLNALVKKNKVSIYPIDSEHSALYQCLKGEDIKNVKRLIITASGGPFRDKKLSELKNVTVAEAIHHPTWKMGPKISIDSATLVNKGLEVMEAHYLFNLPYAKISVVIQKESIVHSLVEFIDGSIKAQLGVPNMEVPIQYALFSGEHHLKTDAYLDFTKPLDLHFMPIDETRFKAVKLAYEAGEKGLSYPLVYNASNEVAVQSFREGELAFCDIVQVIEKCLAKHTPCKVSSYTDIIRVDEEARELALSIIKEAKK